MKADCKFGRINETWGYHSLDKDNKKITSIKTHTSRESTSIKN